MNSQHSHFLLLALLALRAPQRPVSRVRLSPAAARHVLIAVNPNAGSRSREELIQGLETALRQRDLSPELVHSREEITERSQALLAAGQLRALVCAGGDGTIAFGANATTAHTPLAVLPLGTENLLSKYLGLRQDVTQLAETIAEGWTCCFDAGWAQQLPREEDPPPEGRLFTLMAGVGFDADVVRQVHENRKGHIHHLTYAKPIWSTIRRYRYPELRVTCGEQVIRNIAGQTRETITWSDEVLRVRWVFVANLPRYAGNLQIVPDADGLDGTLDICTFKGGSFWKGIQFLGAILMRRHRAWSTEVQTFRSTCVRIEADEPVNYQLDGDYGGTLPLEVKVLPERLKLLTPRSWLETMKLDAPGLTASSDN